MRPLARPPWEPWFEGADAGLVAQSAFGRFCAACERHLNEGVEAWDARTGRRAAARATASEWDDLLPLCVNCLAAVEAAEQATGPGDADLRPDRAALFEEEAAAPTFTYVLVPVAVREDEAGDASAQCTVERVLVRGHTPAAVAMIERFALNTPQHVVTSSDDEGVLDALLLPAGTPLGLLDAYDPRLERRTEAWVDAHIAADALAAAPPGGRGVALRSLGWGMRFTGFWSVWAQVLWERLQDDEVLARVRDHPAYLGTRAA
jgi:hypothetical protein